MPVRITALYSYPIKACGRLEHQSAALEAYGLAHDRHWMFVSDSDETRGRFLTQRELPPLAVIQPSFVADDLHIEAPGHGSISVPLMIAADTPTRSVVIWRDTADAHDEGDRAAAWASAYLGTPVRLVRMAQAHYRRVDPTYSQQTAQVGFADAYPILVTNESSLDDLNDRLLERDKDALPMTRFRPNVVIADADAWAEDAWSQFEIAGIRFEGVKLCARCAVTTVDQETGTRPDVTEPTATLATFRKRERGVMFGQNVVHRGTGMLSVGDAVRVVEVFPIEAP
ncbi:MAG: MOSC domain-containing protein [Chloroflexota bacterium]|nr:MOSC domain-containing protein [Chloroflexota bacterium]